MYCRRYLRKSISFSFSYRLIVKTVISYRADIFKGNIVIDDKLSQYRASLLPLAVFHTILSIQNDITKKVNDFPLKI